MGYNYVKYKDTIAKGIAEFICDEQTDIASLPTSLISPGSKATVIATGKKYILNSKKQWSEFKRCGKGDSGGTTPAPTPSEDSNVVIVEYEPGETESEHEIPVTLKEKTFADIKAELAAEKVVFAKVNLFDTVAYIPLISENAEGEGEGEKHALLYSAHIIDTNLTLIHNFYHESGEDVEKATLFMQDVEEPDFFVATFTIEMEEGQSEPTITCDKTYQQIFTALSGDKTVIGKTVGLSYATVPNVLYVPNDGGAIFFSGSIYNGSGIVSFGGVIHADDTITPLNS